MKHSLVVLSLLVSSFSFAGTIGNGIELSNLPTASKGYEVNAFTESDIDSKKELVAANCKKDKAEAEAIVAKMGSKILSSKGCSVRVTGGYFGQGGSDYKVVSDFEVVFK